MRDGTITRGAFIEAVRTVLLREGVSLDSLKGKAPYGFWSKVGTLTGQEATAAQVYWGRVKKKGLSPDEEAWLSNVDMVDQAQEAVRQDASDATTVAKVDKGEEVLAQDAPGIANVDNLDAEAETQQPTVKYDKVDKHELESMLHALELRLTTLIDRRIEDAMATHESTKDVTFDNLDMPPIPPKVGEAKKKFKGSKKDLRVRIDKNLYDLLEKDVKAHFGENWSRALDAVLWRYYSKPQLSFEE